MIDYLVWLCKFICLCDVVMFSLIMYDIIKDAPDELKRKIKAKGTSIHSWVVMIGSLIIFIVPIVNLVFAFVFMTKSKELKQTVLDELQKEYGYF